MGRFGIVIAVACAIVLGACNSLEPKLDGPKIARAIQQSARNQFGDVHAIVGKARCPAGRLQRKHDHFDCHVIIDGQDAVYLVNQVDGHGAVRFNLVTNFLLFSTIDDQTLADLRGQGLDNATVACGYAHVWFVTPPASRDCVVTLSDHSSHTARVSIAADGGVEKVVVPGLNP